jgi:hypothetical protein
MILVDANLLLHAYNPRSADHDADRACARSREQLQLQRRRQRLEVAPVRRADSADAEYFGKHGDRGIHESQIEIAEAIVDLANTRVPVLRQVDRHVVTFGEAPIERAPRLTAEPMAEQVVDFGNHEGRYEQLSRLGSHERGGSAVPRVIAVVVSVEHARVEKN